MKQRWTDDELLQDFTLHPDELSLLTSTTDSNRLGFAVLLKCFKYEGRFPQNPSSIPTEIIGYIAQQIDVQPEALAGMTLADVPSVNTAPESDSGFHFDPMSKRIANY